VQRAEWDFQRLDAFVAAAPRARSVATEAPAIPVRILGS
jgi:hypothetical protein